MKNVLLLALSMIALNGFIANVDRIQASELDNYSEKEICKSIVVVKYTKKDMLLLLGAPTTPGEFKNASNWIYVSEKQTFYLR